MCTLLRPILPEWVRKRDDDSLRLHLLGVRPKETPPPTPVEP